MWRRVALHLSPSTSSSGSSTLNQPQELGIIYHGNTHPDIQYSELFGKNLDVKMSGHGSADVKFIEMKILWLHDRPSSCIVYGASDKMWVSMSSKLFMLAKGGLFPKGKVPFLSFVLGGPGSGKGTQCTKIVKNFGLTHLSAGELLRREIASNSEYGAMILNTIKEGKIVPSEVTVSLIRKEMESSDNHKFLIDGFPRSEENRAAFERIVGVDPDIVLFFDCPEEEMVNRVLNRNEGRIDDNIDTVRKRLKVFKALNLPVINYYSRERKLHTINAVGSVDEIFEQVRAAFAAVELVTE